MLTESLDKIYPITRIKPRAPWILDEWHFDVGSNTHVIRVVKIPAKHYGRKTSQLIFGVKRGKNVSKKLTGVTNIRQYLATVVSAIEKMGEDPTTKLKSKGDGFIVSMGSDVFEERGKIFLRILQLKLRKTFKLHKSYFDIPTDDSFKGIYIWKKERSFNSVFSNLEIEDDSDEEVYSKPPAVKPTTADVVKNMVRAKLDIKEPLEKKSEPVIDAQLAPNIVKVEPFKKKQDRAKKEASFTLKETKVNIPSYLKIVVLYTFFKNSYGSEKWAKDTSLNTSTVNISSQDIIEYIKKKGNFTHERQIGLASNNECLIALNLKNIKTDHIYDMIERRENVSSYFLKDLEKMGIDTKLLLSKLPETIIENVSIDKIVDICINAKSILKEHGFEINEGDGSPYSNRQRQDIEANRTLNFLISEQNLSTEEIIDIFNGVLASVDPMEIENTNPFKYEKSAKGSKIVIERKYDYSDNPAIETLGDLSQIIDKIYDTDKEKYYELHDRLPYFFQGMITEDLDFFETLFISNWTLSGGSNAQILGHEVFHNFGVNAELDDFYNTESPYDKQNREQYRDKKERLNNHLSALYEKNQQYYKDKYKKRYDTKTIKLYRGVGVKTVDSYIPGSLESWTTQVSTAKRFAAMMSRRDEEYTILTAEVPIQDIFGSWDSFSETWPGEEDLKGKKEYIVMGGTFATTPIYTYDVNTKETISTLKPFKEWVEMTEAKTPKKDAVKIMTPSMTGFKKALNSKKSALGNDPKENEVRKSDDEKDG